MNLIKQILIILVVIFVPISVNAQYFKIFDIDITNYPEIKAKYVAVDEKGRQVHNFQTNDIKLYENNEPVKINQHRNSVKGTPQALSIVLTVDVSGSMNSKKMEIAKEASKTVIKLTPLEISEIAITSFDHKNYLNQDFTKNANLLNSKIDSLIPLGGTDYNFGFTKPVAGALNVAKNGFYKRVVIFLTDGLSDGNTEKIIKYANDNKITIYCISVDMEMPDVLKNVSEKTGGRNFANVQNVTQANKVYTDILQIEQASTYGTISWTATQKKLPEITELTVSATNNNKEILGTSEYKTDENKTVRLKISYVTLNFGKLKKIGDYSQAKIRITAKNADQTITKFENTNNHVFKLIAPPLPFVLKNNQTETIVIKYIPKDFGWISSKIDIETKKGYKINLFATGGDPALPSDFDDNFKFVFPTANTSLFANTDSSITWSGINKSDTVNLFFSNNGGRDYTRLGATQNLSFRWQIPYNEMNNCKFKLTKIIDLKENIILDTNYLSKIKYSPKSKTFTLIDNEFDKLCIFNEKKQLITLSQIKENQFSPDNYFVSNTGKYIVFIDKNSNASLWDIINNKKKINLERHKLKISNVVFSHDDSLFVTIANSKKAVVWDTKTGNLINEFSYTKRSNTIAISPDKQSIAIAYNDNNIIVWDIKTGNQISKLKKHKSHINTLEFSRDSKTLLSASKDGLVIVWDIKANKKVKVFKHKKNVTNAFFASNDQKIISTSADNTAIIWDINNKKNKIILNKHTSGVLDAEVNRQENKLLTLSKDKTAILWEYPSGKYLKTIELKTASPKNIVYFDNNQFVISNKEVRYDLCNLDSTKTTDFYYTTEKTPGSLIHNFKNETATIVNVDFNNASNRLVLATVDGTAKIKDLTGKTLKNADGVGGKISYNPDEKSIFAINKNIISVWMSASNNHYTIGGSLGHTENITVAQYSPDSLMLLTASQDGVIKLWNAKNHNRIADIRINMPIILATFNNSGTKIVATTEKNIFIIDIKTKKITKNIDTKNIQIDIKITPDNDKIITTDGDVTAIYKLQTGKELHNFNGSFIDIIEGSNKFAIKNDDALIFIDYQTGGILYEIFNVDSVYDFSPDGNRYITKEVTGLVVCDINTGKMLYKLDFDLFKGTFNMNLNVFFSPDGNKIIIVNNDNISMFYAPQLLIAESELFEIVAPKPQKHDVVFDVIFVGKGRPIDKKVISNNTKYPIIINDIKIEGKNADCFNFGKVFSKQIVQPGGSLLVELKFDSNSWGEKFANIIIYTPTDTLVSAIRGMVVKKIYEMVNSEINFGKVIPLQEKDTTIVIFKNTTGSDIEITRIRGVGPDKDHFYLNSDKDIIKSGESLSAIIKFNPEQRGLTNCNFQIYLKGYNTPIDFTANGEGDAPRRINVSGIITDKDSHKFVDSKIYCYDYMTGRLLDSIKTDIYGKYNIEISVDREYVLIAEAPNYLPSSKKINLTRLILDPVLECNMEISPIKKDGYSIIHSISFESGDTKLTNDIIVELDHFLKILKKNKNIEIEISGHTDNVGGEESNKKISLERANSIVNYMIIKGIDTKRLTTIGQGESNPIAPNTTEKGREKNRRVEIKITKM